ncbi:MAG: aldo/keto reductase [Actinobacteria bacterium]|nr:aldo/keto reductase [Actinomycetota bacterium]MBU1943930.1 aldo/keto reductase [Actinomycetota bacterium]MBU2686982.1 aldo/keto reductase [Actinomycetota bacterium]
MSATPSGARRVQLGRTGIEISPIGLGTWQFAEGKGLDRFVYECLDQDLVNEIVRTALVGGINWFDTAEAYGWGRSERCLAAALRANGVADEDVVVATKWMPGMRTAASIGRTIVTRRRCLYPYSISLHQVHQPIALASVKAQMDAMADLVELGLIRSVGVSNFWESWMRKAHAALQKRGLPLASNQVKVSLLNRRIETNGLLAAAKDLGVTIIAWSPLEMGMLTGKFHEDPDLLKCRPLARRHLLRLKLESSRELVGTLGEIADANGVSTAVVALSWLVNYYGDTVVAIPGATKVSQAEQNVMANELKLTAKETGAIDELSKRFRRRVPFGP